MRGIAWLTYSNQHWHKLKMANANAALMKISGYTVTTRTPATSTSGCTVATGNFATSHLSLVATRPELSVATDNFSRRFVQMQQPSSRMNLLQPSPRRRHPLLVATKLYLCGVINHTSCSGHRSRTFHVSCRCVMWTSRCLVLATSPLSLVATSRIDTRSLPVLSRKK